VRLAVAILATLALATPGCTPTLYATDFAGPSMPQLAYIAPDLEVVVDSDVPIFFTEGYYWQLYAGYWYRSTAPTSGWVGVRRIPQRLRAVERPQRFARYHVTRARLRDAPIVVDRGTATAIRDHRTPRRAPPPEVRDDRAPAPPPQLRPHPQPAADDPARKPTIRGPAIRDRGEPAEVRDRGRRPDVRDRVHRPTPAPGRKPPRSRPAEPDRPTRGG